MTASSPFDFQITQENILNRNIIFFRPFPLKSRYTVKDKFYLILAGYKQEEQQCT